MAEIKFLNAQDAYNYCYKTIVRDMAVKPNKLGGMSDLDIAITEMMSELGYHRVDDQFGNYEYQSQ